MDEPAPAVDRVDPLGRCGDPGVVFTMYFTPSMYLPPLKMMKNHRDQDPMNNRKLKYRMKHQRLSNRRYQINKKKKR